jgi:serine/threonine protein kinase/TolA-binding protein
MAVRVVSNSLIGQTLGHYRVIEQLGAGGMGVVYRAKDMRLGRFVALKVLPAGNASSDEAVERFRREARTASSLNHPNICTVYEFDEHEGQCYLALELLDGEPLDRRVGGRALELQPLLDIGVQVTEALDAAHSEGILHRDIKPPNIFITRRGQVKVLDFGLAKLASNARHSTVGGMETQAGNHFTSVVGTTVGTIAYMSPEQARGEDLDARTDLFSFGVVLYEMATGRQSFPGTTTAVVFDGILNRDPVAPSSFNATVPGELDRIVSKALEKDRTLRYQTAGDLRADLQRLRRDSGSRRVAVASGVGVPYTPHGADPASAAGSAGPVSPAPVSAAPVYAPPSAAEPPPPSAPQVVAPPPSPTVTSATAGPSRTRMLVLAGVVVAALTAVATGLIVSIRSPAPESDTALAAAPPALVPSPESVAPDRPSGIAAPPSEATPPPASTAVPGVVETRPPVTKGAPPPATPAPPVDATSAEAAQRMEVARAKIASNLVDQGVADLRAIMLAYPNMPIASDAGFLAAETLERSGRTDDAMAAYLEFGRRYPNDSRAVDSKLRRALLLSRARQSERRDDANGLFGEIARDYPRTPQAKQALVAKRQYEATRKQLRATDPILNIEVPAILVTWRMIADQFPSDPETMLALNSLAAAYADMNRYQAAAEVWEHMARQFPPNPMEVWWTLGDLYDRRLKDPARAREAWARVPPESPRYRDAQQRLRR